MSTTLFLLAPLGCDPQLGLIMIHWAIWLAHFVWLVKGRSGEKGPKRKAEVADMHVCLSESGSGSSLYDI